MKYFFCLICFISSVYANKTYTTTCAVEVNAPAEISDTIFARFIHDFQSSPDALFDWALYGTGTQNDEAKNAFLLDYKETIYIPEENYGRVTTDVVIPGFTRFRNIVLEGTVIDESHPIAYLSDVDIDSLKIHEVNNWSRHFYIDVTYSKQLLEHGFGNMFIIPIDSTHSAFLMDINIKYGWFFNIFVNMKVYKNSVEWRVNRYMHNLKKVAEELYEEQSY